MAHLNLSLLGATALALLSSACVSPTPYQPASASSMHDGYSSSRIEPDRYRVGFSGNRVTSRETVETYLLFRAAQLTVERGNNWFSMVERQTERHSETYVNEPFNSGPYGYWGPAWRYRGRSFGWRDWDPISGDPYFDRQIDVTTVDRYEATAEIVMGRGPKASSDHRAFDARAVIENLRPSIKVPQ
jgi:hypothetical protein